MSTFLNYSLELLETFKNVNKELYEFYGVYFIQPFLLDYKSTEIKTELESGDVLGCFLDHFNELFDYDMFVKKDLNYIRKVIEKRLPTLPANPFVSKESILQSIDEIFENDYLEADHINELHRISKCVIKSALKENDFIPADKRWLDL